MQTRIFVNTRPTWYQVNPDPPEHPGVVRRMREIATAEFVRLRQSKPVTVYAYREGHEVVTTTIGRETHCETCSCVHVVVG